MTDIEPVELFTPGEVAALFRVDPKTVARWHKTGKLADHGIEVLRTLGGQRRFVASTVRRYLAEQDGGAR
jgi:predicted site-specific integrase-resolvase